MEEDPAKQVGDDMLRLRVRSTLESISAEEGCKEPIARIVFVQYARQAATRLGLRKWKSRTQSEQEAGEESLHRFLDGVWEYRNGKRELQQGNADWVLRIWEVGCEEWNRHLKAPKQLAIEAPTLEALAVAAANPFESVIDQLSYAITVESWPLTVKALERLRKELT